MESDDDKKPRRRSRRPLSRAALDREMDVLENVLFRNPVDLDPDDAGAWHEVGGPAELEEWLRLGVIDPRTVLALLDMGIDQTLLATKRAEVE